MKITLYLRYHTNFGETLSVKKYSTKTTDNKDSDRILMNYFSPEYWTAEFDLDTAADHTFCYSYELHLKNGEVVPDGEHLRTIEIAKKSVANIHTFDSWNNEGFIDNVFYTAPFRNVLIPESPARTKTKIPKSFTHIFRVKVPFLKKNEQVCLTGSGLELGDWKQADAIRLSKEGDWWTTKLALPQESFPIQYNYGITESKDNQSIVESGENRFLPGIGTHDSLTILHDGFARLPIQKWKGAGVAIPVFSLKSKKSFGIGEFDDIKLLADWAKEAGIKLIQILPVNDTIATFSFADSYPYAAISAFALHPVYINLEATAGKKHAALLKGLKKKQKELNDLPAVDYVEVLKYKLEILRQICDASREEYLENTDFYAFFTANKHWLAPYAAFSYLRNKNGTADSSLWKTNKEYSKDAIAKFVSPKAKHYSEIFLHYFIQYHLHLQLKDSTEYAHKKGIVLKGDIPIGIYRYSCDAWMSPGLYNMDMQAGAPPDDFAVKGQNWGFPTYNWQKMQEDGFDWWRKRFEQMSNYFDAFRIDHILGFFRIWSIPLHAVEGIMGYFVPAVPVHINEFAERDIWFDKDRYTRPFVTWPLLHETFGEEAMTIKDTYFEGEPLQLKPEFDTQQKVAEYFNTREKNAQNDNIKTRLFNIISNVILFEVPDSGGNLFHFRITMDKTSSFQSLEWNTQSPLKDLYLDYFYRRQEYNWRKEALKKLPELK
ncbi:MAG: 4-alpha-glucanotransferase, partial [Chitinophagaceae bacterium]